jgi:hypothetical protein
MLPFSAGFSLPFVALAGVYGHVRAVQVACTPSAITFGSLTPIFIAQKHLFAQPVSNKCIIGCLVYGSAR